MKNTKLNIDKIEEIIMAFANGDYSSRLEISDELNEIDILSSGINMLGEELEEKSISKDFVVKILNSIPQVVVVFSKSGKIEILNSYADTFFELKEKNKSLTIQNFFPKSIHQKLTSFLKTKSIGKNFKIKICHPKIEGVEVFLLCSLNKIIHLKNETYLFIAKDITSEKAEEKRIIKATLMGQELERKRLAYDLHDSLGQELNAIKMFMNAMEFMDIESYQFKKSLKDIHQMLDDTIDSVRNISYNLTPNMLENNDLCSCLRIISQKLIKRINVTLEFPVKKIHLENKNIELFIYRIFQEFINNTLKYALANNITFKIKDHVKLKKYIFLLEDDGIGFNIKELQYRNGIYNIKNRLETLNFKYKFSSKLNKGTKLYFEVNYK
ncbi:MAG: histidine kinase [Flavobacteriia bacterium]|jgi:signal transduction histidine kinase